jgi:hypothetical protein
MLIQSTVLCFHRPRIVDSPGADGNTSVLSPNSVDLSLSGSVLDSVPGRFVATGADTEASPGSSVPETTTVVPSSIATPVAPSATDLVLGSSGLASAGTASTDQASSTVPQQRGRTRLQNNIIQPKRLFLGMICYANFCATGEP